MVKLTTLATIAGVGGMITSLTGFALHGILQNRVKNSVVYKEAMKLVNNHPSLIELMGKPIQSSNVNVLNPNNILSLTYSSLELPVYGPKTNGVLYIWADRCSAEENWNLHRLELEILDDSGGRVSILKKEPVKQNVNQTLVALSTETSSEPRLTL